MIEALIGHTFSNKHLLEQALTHPSHSTSNFQVFEFLGDRVLGLIIADIIFKKNVSVKSMAGNFANLVNTEALVKIANYWNVKSYLKHDIQFISNKVLADVVEALIAAIYLDSDFSTIFVIVENLYHSQLRVFEGRVDFKMHLQELAQSKLLDLPEYTLIDVEGLDHKKIYTIQVSVNTLGSAVGKGYSKHEASKVAAQNLLCLLDEKN